jgi:hypothetical protein
MTPGPLAPLPVQVRPRHGETASSYIRRLARANHLRPSYLRSLICSPPHRGAIRADPLATLSGRSPESLRHSLAGLERRAGTGPPQLARTRQPAAEDAGNFEAIRREAAADPTVPVRVLAARHQVSRRTVLQALTPPSSAEGNPHPPWPGPVLDPLRELIDTWLTEEPGLSGYKIWERLLDEHDAEISYERISTYLNRQRARLSDKTHPEPASPAVSQMHPRRRALPVKKARAGHRHQPGPIYLARDTPRPSGYGTAV